MTSSNTISRPALHRTRKMVIFLRSFVSQNLEIAGLKGMLGEGEEYRTHSYRYWGLQGILYGSRLVAGSPKPGGGAGAGLMLSCPRFAALGVGLEYKYRWRRIPWWLLGGKSGLHERVIMWGEWHRHCTFTQVYGYPSRPIFILLYYGPVRHCAAPISLLRSKTE